MIVKLYNKNDSIAQEIVKLQKKSYSIEAQIIGYDEIPNLKDTVDSIKECEEVFFGYFIDDMLAGMITYKIIDDILDIHRMAVNPEHFRKGIAEKLISYIQDINRFVKKIVVSTGRENLPAVKLYEKLGFIKVEEFQVEKNLWIASFEKSIS